MKEQVLFTIGWIAAVVGRTVPTVRRWEAQGLIEITPYRSKNGHRLYTRQQIEQVMKWADRQGRSRKGIRPPTSPPTYGAEALDPPSRRRLERNVRSP
jgi:DNA-binding transcriptional MerR regulator